VLGIDSKKVERLLYIGHVIMAKQKRTQQVALFPGGPLKNAVLVDIVESDEKICTYDLDDGSQVRLRTVVTEIWRIEDEYDAEGNPMYSVKAQGTMSVIAPEKLRRTK